MLSPYPTALRARAQSNPSQPKFGRSNSSQDAADTTRGETCGDVPGPASRPGTAGPRPGRSLTAGSLASTPSLVFSSIQEVPPAHHDKKPTKKLQRPRRGSLFASTSPVQLVPTSPLSPSTAEWRPSSYIEPPPSPSKPPTRPPRNPARITPSDAIRPSSSSGARDYKALWDSAPGITASSSAGPNDSSGFPYNASPLLNKFVRRNKSVSVKVNGNVDGRPGSAGVGPASRSGSLLTKSGRTERRERELEGEKSPSSSKKQDSKRDKGKGKEKDDPTFTRERAEQNSLALAHALNTYAYASASLAPVPIPTPKPTSAKHPSKLHHSKAHSRPHSQIVAPPLSQTPHTSNASRDSHSTNSNTPSDPSGIQKSASTKDKEKVGPNFSTLDRTILEELRHSMTARDSQFLFKGPGGGFGQKGEKGIMHHPFTKEEVPYPRSYDRGVIDLDVWESSWIQQVCDSVTWHVFKTPPTKVLDLGCGTGSWIMECAKRWKQCHFVGLDIVPLQPDLKRVGSSNMASRITWVQANFLDGLPFPNEEFDFVHIKRIARGVPEDKWDALFDEVTRVMKPRGAFEMLEEDLYWPGKPREDSESESGSSPESNSTSKVSSPFVGSPTDASARSETPSTPRPTPTMKEEPKSTLYRPPSPVSLFHAPPTKASAPPTTPAHAHGRPPALMISTMLSTPSKAAVNNAAAEGKINSESSRPSTSESSSTPSHTIHSHHRTSFSPSTPTTSISISPEFSQFSPVKPSFSYPHLVRTAPKPPVNPRDHSTLETIYAEMHAARFINLAPLSLLPNNLSSWFRDVRTHPTLNITFPPPPVHPRVRSPLTRPDVLSSPQAGSDDEFGFSDHESSPVKAETVDTHGPGFRRMHSVEDSQATIRQKPLTTTTENPASSPIISLEGLILGVSPYAYLDDPRYTAFSPSGKASFSSLHGELSARDMLPAAAAVMPTSTPTNPEDGSQNTEAPDHQAIMKTLASLEGLPSTSVPNTQSAEAAHMQDLATTLATFKIRLPNTTLRLDLRTLNLHLAARTSEILACAEAMWEWVLEFQAENRKRKEDSRLRSGSVDRSPSTLRALQAGQPEDPIMTAIAELTRADFDGLLTQFNLDMRDQYALGSALEERFAWSVVPMPATQDRKLFDVACDKWEQYQRQQRQDQITESQHHPYRRHSHHSQLFSEAAATLSHLPTIPDTITMRNGSTRPTINFAKSHLSRDNSGRPGGRHALSKSRSYASLRKEPLSEPLGYPHPSHFLCRTMRVFVAWKA